MGGRSSVRGLRPVVVLVLGAGVLTGCSGGAGQQPGVAGAGCAALEGETVTLVVPYSPGGGYDTQARLVAPYLEDELGTTVVVENREGAGGLLAINDLMTTEPDGTTIAIMNGLGGVGAALAGAPGAVFDPADLTFLGRVAGESHLAVVGASTGYTSWDDARTAADFQWASTGPGAGDYMNPSFLTSAFSMDAEVVTGFPGSSESELAVTSGNAEGMTGDLSSRRNAVESGDHVPLMVIGRERPDWLSEGVPLITEIDATPGQKALIDAHVALVEVGRPLVAPPGMDEGLTTCLRDALAAAEQNPDLLAEAEEQERPLNYIPAEELESLVRQVQNAPTEYRDLLATFFAAQS